MRDGQLGRRRVGATALTAVLIAGASCSSSDAAAPAAGSDGGVGAEAGTGAETGASSTSIIHLAESSSVDSKITTRIAKQLLTEHMGVKVDIVEASEDDQWSGIHDGKLDASLEAWPSGVSADVRQWLDVSQIEDGGKLGVERKIGWYIPTYLLADKPELSTWEGFKSPENVALFSTAETGAKGRFLAGDPGWEQHDGDIIKNLNLALEVVVAGTEEVLLTEVDEAYSRRKPILFYFWAPHWALKKYELTNVKLPAYSDACWAKRDTGGMDCDYPTEEAHKILRPALKTDAPKVHQFLAAFSYSTTDQVDGLAAVAVDHKTPDDAAKAWIDAHESIWETWIPK